MIPAPHVGVWIRAPTELSEPLAHGLSQPHSVFVCRLLTATSELVGRVLAVFDM